MDRVVDYPSCAHHAGELAPELAGSQPPTRVRLPDGRVARLVTLHDEVRAVLTGGGFTRDIGGDQAGMRTVNMDGRPHLELRGLVAKAFTARRVDAMRPFVEKLAEDLLDDMERGGPPADLVAGFAVPLPAVVICRLLGFPEDDFHLLNGWCDRITVVGAAPDQTAWQELGAYVGRLAQAKSAALAGGEPDADVLTTLVCAHEAGQLTYEEMVSLTIVVLAGGLETTQTAIAAGLLRLLLNPDQLDKLRADPDLLEPAIEEILRRQPVIDMNRVQVATRDVQLGEHLVPAGELVQISINAANRDEGVFPHAAAFDVSRQPNPHLAFGFGAHHCLGAAAARLELRTAFSALFRRFPRLALAVPAESLHWRGGHVTLSLQGLPVTW
jgi:cytochrome P450